MSVRNIMIIHSKRTTIDELYAKIEKALKNIKIGVVFEPKGYQDELISKLGIVNKYMSFTDEKNIVECENLFDCLDSYEYSIKFSKEEQSDKEEFLINKLSFLDKIIEIIFDDNQTKYVEFFVSDQYSLLIEDYDIVEVENRMLCIAVVNSFKPISSKNGIIAKFRSLTKNSNYDKENYYGLKTKRFIIR